MTKPPIELVSTRRLPGGSDDDALAETVGSGGGERGARDLASTPKMIGRYRVTGRLGAGGMGEVLRAHDAELDRNVAIKLVRGDQRSLEATARLTREARAMARLAHPSVVTVFEVGTVGEDVFVAMELVDGVTLTRWLAETPRPWREVVAMFGQAGAGLAAAHRSGLVHRDFKPDNVLIDREGRARVTDFGLAALAAAEDRGGAGDGLAGGSPRLTLAGAVMGTPVYMSPEQHAGEATDARSDQFSFCVTLHEALFGERPFTGDSLEQIRTSVLEGAPAEPGTAARVPTWLRAAIRRGLARDPAQRFESMDALLTELTRDRAAGRRRVVIVAAVVAAASAAAGVAWLAWGRDRVAHVDPCAQAGTEIRAQWDADARAAIERSFTASGRSYAAETARRVSSSIDAWTGAWTAAHQASCRATVVRHEQSAERADLRSTCLARARSSFGAQLALWIEPPDAGAVVDRAIAAAARLPDVAACDDVAALESIAPLPLDPAQRAAIETTQAEIDTLHARLVLGAVPDGVGRSGALVARSEATGYAPLTVDALAVLALAHAATGDFEAATATLRKRVQAAATARDHAAEAEAWIELIYQIGVELLRFDESLALREAGEAALRRAGANPELEAALLYRLGQVHGYKGDVEQAVALLRQAHERIGEHDVETATAIDIALGEWLGDAGEYVEAATVLEAAQARATAALGQDHPQVALVMAGRASADYGRGDSRAAAAGMRAAVTQLEKVRGSAHIDVATLHNNLAVVLLELGELDEARTESERALVVYRTATPLPAMDIAHTLNNLALVHAGQGRPADAVAAATESIDVARRALGADHRVVGNLGSTLAQALLEAGDLRAARGFVDDGIRILARSGPEAADALARAVHRRGDIALASGDRAGARRDHDRALELATALTGDGGVTTLELAGMIGERWLDAGRARDALGYLRRALVLAERGSTPAEAPMYRFMVGRAQIEGDVDAAAGWTLVRAARAELAAADHPAVGDVDAWIAQQPGATENERAGARAPAPPPAPR